MTFVLQDSLYNTLIVKIFIYFICSELAKLSRKGIANVVKGGSAFAGLRTTLLGDQKLKNYGLRESCCRESTHTESRRLCGLIRSSGGKNC